MRYQLTFHVDADRFTDVRDLAEDLSAGVKSAQRQGRHADVIVGAPHVSSSDTDAADDTPLGPQPRVHVPPRMEDRQRR